MKVNEDAVMHTEQILEAYGSEEQKKEYEEMKKNGKAFIIREMMDRSKRKIATPELNQILDPLIRTALQDANTSVGFLKIERMKGE